jgi:hypothetical protein
MRNRGWHKFKAVATEVNGIKFPSKHEAAVYSTLLELEKSGIIRDIKRQIPILLSAAKIKMVVDFQVYSVPDKDIVFIEAKGAETPTYRIKRRLWLAYGPGTLQVYGGSYKRPKLKETLVPTSLVVEEEDLSN